MKRLLIVGPMLALSGCILVAQQQAQQGKTALVGKSRAEILACAGVPNATFRDGGTEYFAYSGSGMLRSGGSTTYVGGGVFLHSGGGGQSQCVATLAFQGGRVANVSYRSSGGAVTAPDEACGNIVKSCL